MLTRNLKEGNYITDLMRQNPSFHHGSEINGSHWDVYIFRLLIMTCTWYIPQEDSMPSSYSCLPTDDIILFVAETIRKPSVPGQISIIFHHLYSVTVLCCSFDLKYYLLKTSEFIFLNVLFSLSSICFFCFFLCFSLLSCQKCLEFMIAFAKQFSIILFYPLLRISSSFINKITVLNLVTPF